MCWEFGFVLVIVLNEGEVFLMLKGVFFFLFNFWVVIKSRVGRLSDCFLFFFFVEVGFLDDMVYDSIVLGFGYDRFF